MLPYRSSSPASRADAESVVAALGCASELVEITAMVDGYFGTGDAAGASGPDGLEASPLRRGNFAARMRMAVLYDRSVTWGGLVVGTGNKTESLIGYTTVFGDCGLRLQPDRRPVQEPGPPAGRRPGRPGRDRPQGAVGGPVARARPTRPRAASATRSSTGSCSGGSTSDARSTRWSALGFERAMVERVDRMVAGAEFKRQVPPIAKLGPRTAGVDYLYPRRRPGSARG